MQELIILFLIAFTILATLLLKSSFSYDSDVNIKSMDSQQHHDSSVNI